MSATDGSSTSRSGGTRSVVPWIAFMVIGIALLVVGIVVSSNPLHRGGPIMLGILLILDGGLQLARTSRG